MTRRIAIAAHRASDEGHELYPDPDWPLLEAALVAEGVDAVALSWDAAGVAWDAFDLVVVRSTWDSADRPDEFLAWARTVPSLANNAEVIAWNLDKRYLAELADAGVEIVPTTWTPPGTPWTAPPPPFVVKPAVSAGGRETARYEADPAAAAAHVARLHAAGHTVMTQPYVRSVDTDGETKLVFIAGEYSHALRVGALLDADEGVIDRPWEEKPVDVAPFEPTAAQLAVGESVVAQTAARFGDLLYARVDLVGTALMELELIEPVLGLRIVPEAAKRLARACVAV